MFEEIELESLYLNLSFSLLLFFLFGYLPLSKLFIELGFEFPDDFLRLFWLFHEHLDDGEGLFEVIDDGHDLGGPAEVVLAELVDDADVFPVHLLEFLAELPYFEVNGVGLLSFHFVIL